MPTYEYQCEQCGRQFEVRQRITDAPLASCDACGGPVRRLLSPAPFILKGQGWYVTDYPSEARKKAMESEKGAVPAAAGDGKSADKPATPAPSSPTSSAPAPPSSPSSSSD